MLDEEKNELKTVYTVLASQVIRANNSLEITKKKLDIFLNHIGIDTTKFHCDVEKDNVFFVKTDTNERFYTVNEVLQANKILNAEVQK